MDSRVNLHSIPDSAADDNDADHIATRTAAEAPSDADDVSSGAAEAANDVHEISTENLASALSNNNDENVATENHQQHPIVTSF